MTSAVSAVTRTTTMVSSTRSKPARRRSSVKAKLLATGAAPQRPLFIGERLFPQRERLVDQLLAAGHLLGEFIVDRRARLDEGILVGVVDLHPRFFQFLVQAVVKPGGDLVD